MIISNVSRGQIYYSVQDQSGQFNDGGTIDASGYVEFQPRGQAPFKVSYASVTLTSVPSPAIVTFWSSNGGGFSE
jgi:hypothetical protein